MPSVHGAIRMRKAWCNPPAAPAIPRESAFALPTLRRRDPRGKRPSETAARASSTPRTAGRMHSSPCWESVGPLHVASDASVTRVRIAHPATGTFVVALVLLAVFRIESFGLPASPAAPRAPVSHRPSRIPSESSELRVSHVSVDPLPHSSLRRKTLSSLRYVLRANITSFSASAAHGSRQPPGLRQALGTLPLQPARQHLELD